MHDVALHGATLQFGANLANFVCPDRPDLHQYVRAGFGVQALTTGQGALSSLANFSNTFGVDLEEIEKAAENVVS